MHETTLVYIGYSLQVFNNVSDFARQDDPSAMSNVDTDADELNLSTQKAPNGSSANGFSQSKEVTRNQQVLSYNTDPFNNLYLDTQLEGEVSEKVK